MTPNDKYFYRCLFELKLLKANGFVFQNLFENIMKSKYGNLFSIVKPYGNIGDMKNDGFIESENTYFQVYGPENIAKSINNAISKIQTDYLGIVKNWKKAKKIKYVVNDKFKGADPVTYLELQKLNDELTKLSTENISVSLYTCHDLENDFMSLDEDSMISIVGMSCYNVSLDETLDFSCLQELANFILNIESPNFAETLFPPNYEDKIAKNCFSKEISERLRLAHLNHDDIENFFKQYGDFIDSELRNKFIKIYTNAKEIVPREIDAYGDKIYYEILSSICGKNPRRGLVAAAESLVSYYFECCDIFESPTIEVTV